MAKNKPRVLVICRRLERKNKLINWVSEIHLSLLYKENILPMVVPVVKETIPMLSEYAKEMSGLIIVEGGDIRPHYYGKRILKKDLHEVDSLKDEIEIVLCQKAVTKKVPILGICRGMQVLNVVCGGTLHKHVGRKFPGGTQHVNFDDYDGHRHSLRVVPGTPLYRWYKKKNIYVNSYHHQAVDLLPKKFKPMGYSPDGLVEAYYDSSHPYRVGLQFHPERMITDYKGNYHVFQDFGKAVHSYCK